MSVIYLGSKSVGELVPALQTMQAKASADLDQKAAAAASVQASLDVSMGDPAAMLSSAIAFLGSGQALAGLQLMTPAQLMGSLQANAGVQADLSANTAAELGPVLALGALLATTGVHAYQVDASVDHIGPELEQSLAQGVPGGQGTDAGHALVLIATTPAAWAAVQGIFRAQ